MRKLFNHITILFLIGLTYICYSQELNYSLDTKFGEFRYSVIDTNSVKDLLHVCEKEIPKICMELKIDFDNSVIIEIYPSQESYNRSIINSDLKNSPAISGNFRIQLVSPLSPLAAERKLGIINNKDRLYFLIHEYVHILIDKLENPPPLCIDEGIASYCSSKDFYFDMASKYVRQINFIPSVEQMIINYKKIPAPDLFSFLLIDYIVQTLGKEKLADVLRHPNNIKRYNGSWIDYVKNKYY
jgi:hypothetical protein